jgi:hypothetical protein
MCPISTLNKLKKLHLIRCPTGERRQLQDTHAHHDSPCPRLPRLVRDLSH